MLGPNGEIKLDQVRLGSENIARDPEEHNLKVSVQYVYFWHTYKDSIIW